MNVHILHTVLEPRLAPVSDLVFQTIRTGFPTANINISLNGSNKYYDHIASICDRCIIGVIPSTTHDRWIQYLIRTEPEPFWIIDGDVIFWDSMETVTHAICDQFAIAGREEPTFLEPWTNTIHMKRVQTGVMYIDPVLVSRQIREWNATFPSPFGDTAHKNLIRQMFVPWEQDKVLFYDTTVAYQIRYWGTVGTFRAEDNARFEHLNCGTYSNLAGPFYNLDMSGAHLAITKQPEIARGMWTQQQEWLKENSYDLREIT